MSAPADGADPDVGDGRRRLAWHPSAGVGGRLYSAVERASDRLPGIDGPHRRVATAVMAVRGTQHRSAAQFAAAYGLAEAELSAIERGLVAAPDLPAPLRQLTPVDTLLGRSHEG